jgi:hypothetical protein
MGNTRGDDPLKLEVVYYSAPIPRNLAVLTVLGAVFDTVYFPGVYLPKGGFDEAELDREIARLEGLPIAGDSETSLLIGVMKLAKHAKELSGFCEFTGSRENPFHTKEDIPGRMVSEIFEAMHGPPPPGFIPSFSTNHHKALAGSDEHITYPGDYHYLAGAIIDSARRGIPLLNDLPGIPIPGIEDTTPVDKAKILSSIIAIECTRLVLPETPILHPADIMEFREANTVWLRGFRRSMLRYAADLNGKIAGLSVEDFREKTRFFIDTEIAPAMDELRSAMNDPARPWFKRAVDAAKIFPSVAGAFLAGSPAAALAMAITKSAEQFFVEVAAHGDKKEALKRSGLYYLLKLEQFQSDKGG